MAFLFFLPFHLANRDRECTQNSSGSSNHSLALFLFLTTELFIISTFPILTPHPQMFERLTQKCVQTHFHSPVQILVQVEPLAELSLTEVNCVKKSFWEDKTYYTTLALCSTSVQVPYCVFLLFRYFFCFESVLEKWKGPCNTYI